MMMKMKSDPAITAGGDWDGVEGEGREDVIRELDSVLLSPFYRLQQPSPPPAPGQASSGRKYLMFCSDHGDCPDWLIINRLTNYNSNTGVQFEISPDIVRAVQCDRKHDITSFILLLLLRLTIPCKPRLCSHWTFNVGLCFDRLIVHNLLIRPLQFSIFW